MQTNKSPFHEDLNKNGGTKTILTQSTRKDPIIDLAKVKKIKIPLPGERRSIFRWCVELDNIVVLVKSRLPLSFTPVSNHEMFHHYYSASVKKQVNLKSDLGIFVVPEARAVPWRRRKYESSVADIRSRRRFMWLDVGKLKLMMKLTLVFFSVPSTSMWLSPENL